MTELPTTSGCAYTSPSRVGDVQRSRTALGDDGPSGARPLRALSRSYVVHCAALVGAVDVDVAPTTIELVVDTTPGRLDVDEGLAPPEPDEHAANSQTTKPTTSDRNDRATSEGLPVRDGSES
jgi:hypothetical protein